MAAEAAEAHAVPILPELERRSVDLTKVEFREQSDKMIFEGRAAVFGEWADIGGEFREQIKRGAFRKADMSETVLAFNHNLDLVMASAAVKDGPGMLALEESPRGLDVYAELAPTQTARDTRALVETGVIRKMSFGWPRGAAVDDWNDDYSERSINGFKRIIDVSPVVFPAYTGTQASARTSLVDALMQEIRSSGAEGSKDALQALLRSISHDSDLAEELLVRAIGLEPDETATRTETAEESDDAPGLRAVQARLLTLRLKDYIS